MFIEVWDPIRPSFMVSGDCEQITVLWAENHDDDEDQCWCD
jgi:hypothetical protein